MNLPPLSSSPAYDQGPRPSGFSPPPSSNSYQLWFPLLTTALECYEFTVYAMFASLFAQNFFSGISHQWSLIFSWLTFSVGFLARPVGSLVFGWIGDRHSRSQALRLSILVMAIATFSIGCLPTYETWSGAPLLLIALRLLQGFSAGGEINGVALFLMEKYPRRHGALIGGIVEASCLVGAFIGSLVAQWCLANNQWRLAFLIGGGIGLVFFMGRLFMEDTIHESAITTGYKGPLHIHGYTYKFIGNMLFVGMAGTAMYLLLGFATPYLQEQFGYPLHQAETAHNWGLLGIIVSCPLMGALYDRFKHYGRVYWYTLFPTAMALLGLTFWLINNGSPTLGLILWGWIIGTVCSANWSFYHERIPRHIRSRFVGLSFSLGLALLSGTSPAHMNYWIIHHGVTPSTFVLDGDIIWSMLGMDDL